MADPKEITPAVLKSLRDRMVKHAFTCGHREPEEIASQYVVRLLEGLHQTATIGQAYIDIVRLSSGRKSTTKAEVYERRQALTMVASSEEQEAFYSNQPEVGPDLDAELDRKARWERIFNCIKDKRTRQIYAWYLQGWTQEEIAIELGLTPARVAQIISRQAKAIGDKLSNV